MDDQYVSNIEKYQRCDSCENEDANLIYVKDYVPEIEELSVKNEVMDDRKLNKYKYKDSVYNDKVEAINYTYRKGLK